MFMFEHVSEISEAYASEIISNMVNAAGFDGYRIEINSYTHYGFVLFKKSIMCPCVVSPNSLASSYTILASLISAGFTYDKHLCILDAILDNAKFGNFVIVIDNSVPSHRRHILMHPGETLDMLRVKNDMYV